MQGERQVSISRLLKVVLVGSVVYPLRDNDVSVAQPTDNASQQGAPSSAVDCASI